MAAASTGRIKISQLFWVGLRKLRVDPACVLRQANLPLTLCSDDKILVTLPQFTSIWRAIGDLSKDPGVGLKLGSQLQPSVLHPSLMAAQYARDYRDALTRYARFLQLGKFSELSLREFRHECVVEWRWTRAIEEELPLLTDVTFALLMEMGRRGSEHPLNPKRVELRCAPERTGVHRAYFNCPVKFKAQRNSLIFHTADLDRPFVTYNAELLEMLQPAQGSSVTTTDSSTSERVKWVLKRLLSRGRPDASAVAEELGLSVRTLQRRIMDEGCSFRELLGQVRQELAEEYLNQPGMQIQEIAFLLGYEDVASFYRAFRALEGTTPALKRLQLSEVESR